MNHFVPLVTLACLGRTGKCNFSNLHISTVSEINTFSCVAKYLCKMIKEKMNPVKYMVMNS